MEINLVAHRGESTEGQYLNTLTCTDICTGWTEMLALRRCAQEAICSSIEGMRQGLPFDWLGIDSDNGPEFINDLLYRYCLNEQMALPVPGPARKTIRRISSRRNWSVVHRTVDNDGLETEAEHGVLERIYQDLRIKRAVAR